MKWWKLLSFALPISFTISSLSTACSTNVTPYSLPNATISFDKYALTLDQTNNSYTVHGTVTLSDQSEPDHITYVYTDADILPIGFQQVGNNLTISLVPEVTINAQTICIYATYPKSANRPRIPITINVVAYTSPTPEPTPEVWDDTWVPKNNLIINNGVLKGLSDTSNKSILHIPSEVTVIAADAFKQLSGITTVNFADDSKCIKINADAFEQSSITNINFPASLIDLGTGCFFQCRSLVSINLSNNIHISSIPDYFATLCSSLTSLKLPPNCDHIGAKAFSDTRSLSGNIEIPNKVETIGNQAFMNAGFNRPTTNEINLTFAANSILHKLDWAAFSSMSCVSTIDLPSSLKKYGNNCFNTNKATTVKINCPNGFQFGDTVFQEAALTSLYLNVDQYFAYPNKFLDGAQIISNPTAKIYVPSRLLTAFQNGWTEFTNKFVGI